MDHFKNKGVTRHEARAAAIKEFLAYNLTFEDYVLDKMVIKETREASNDKIIDTRYKIQVFI